MQQCCGIKKDGQRCTNILMEGTRCGIHKRTMEKVGPNQIRKDELSLIHKRNIHLIYINFRARRITKDERTREIRLEEINYQTTLMELEFLIEQETIANGGVDADQEYRIRRQELMRRRRDIARQRWQAHEQRLQNNNNINNPVIQHNNNNELQNFANDNQNVHTSLVVQKVKDTITKILKIQVPLEYQTDTLKTLGEIILDCKLSKRAASTMTLHYCGDGDIYNMGMGIYANVLNSIWQYIKTSEHSEDLKKILRNEMEDNIGMCAQGNISRICNILSGYLDGLVVDTRSQNEIIGYKMVELMDIEDIRERLIQAREFLNEQKVPREQWKDWLEPLVDDNFDEAIATELVA